MKKIIIFALGLVFAFSACSDFAEVGDLNKVVSDLDSLNQRLTDLETRVEILEDLDISATVLAIETMQGDISTNLESINNLQQELLDLEDELNNNTGSGDASTVYWGDVVTDEHYTELFDGGYTKVTGRVDVSSVAQIEKLQAIEYIGDNLNLEDISGTIELVALQHVSGSINITTEDEISTSLSFPNLEFVNGNIYSSGTALGLDSINLPILKTVMGDFSLSFNTDGAAFSSLDLPELLLIGGSFNIANAPLLEVFNMATVYVGGNFKILANELLSIGKSNFSDVEHIGQSIYFSSNFIYFDQSQLTDDQLSDAVLFEKLTYIGDSITINDCVDLYKIGGFSSIERVPGDIYISGNILGVGLGEVDHIFNSLTDIGGQLKVNTSTPAKLRTDETIESAFLFGFDNLVNIGGNLQLGVNWIYGFEKLERTAVNYMVEPYIRINADVFPTFKSFIQIQQNNSYLEINTSNTKLDNIFPELVMQESEFDYSDRLHISIELNNETAPQIINGGFGKLPHVGSLSINYATGTSFTNDFLSNLVYIETDARSSVIDEENANTSHITIQVEDDTDLSNLNALFIAKMQDKYLADSAWAADNATYEMVKALYEAGNPDIDEEDVTNLIPVRKDEMTDSFNIYTKEVGDYTNIFTNYYEVKLESTDTRPAYIQCFDHFGDLSEEDLIYFTED